jgi:hypothetical protein
VKELSNKTISSKSVTQHSFVTEPRTRGNLVPESDYSLKHATIELELISEAIIAQKTELRKYNATTTKEWSKY